MPKKTLSTISTRDEVNRHTMIFPSVGRPTTALLSRFTSTVTSSLCSVSLSVSSLI